MLVEGFNNVLVWVQLALALLALGAFVDAALVREDAYRAAGKKTKPFWLIILAVAAVICYFLPLLSFLPVIGVIATVVYLVDVRPAVRGIVRSAGGRRSSSSDGPYGPYNG